MQPRVHLVKKERRTPRCVFPKVDGVGVAILKVDGDPPQSRIFVSDARSFCA